MLSKTLFGRLFQLVPGHFKRMDRLHYYEYFRLNRDWTGELIYNYQILGRTNSITKTKVILRSTQNWAHCYREDMKQINGISGNYIDQKLLLHSRQIDFDLLSPELIRLIDKKSDSNIISCSCCHREAN